MDSQGTDGDEDRKERSSRRSYAAYLRSVRDRLRKKKPPTDLQVDGKGKSRISHETPSFHSSREWDANTATRTRPFRTLLFEFWKQIGVYQPKVLFGLSTLTIATLLGLVPPLATKIAIDCALTKPAHDLPWGFPTSWNEWDKLSLLVAVAALAFLIASIKSLIHLWGRWVTTQSVNQMQASLRRRVFRHILHLPLHRIQAIKSGGATSMLREDAGGVADLIFSMLYNPWQAIVQLVGSFVVLLVVDWRLLACGVLLIPAVYLSHRTWIHRIRPLFRDVRSQRQRVDASSTETFGGIRVVRTFARQQSETRRFTLGNHLLVRQQLAVWWKTRIVELVWEFLIPAASTALLIFGGWQILKNELTLGDLLMFLVYLTMLLGPIATLTGSAVQFQNNLAGLDRILDLLDEPKEMEDRVGAIKISKSQVQGQYASMEWDFVIPIVRAGS